MLRVCVCVTLWLYLEGFIWENDNNEAIGICPVWIERHLHCLYMLFYYLF